jgi:hypothetical protein
MTASVSKISSGEPAEPAGIACRLLQHSIIHPAPGVALLAIPFPFLTHFPYPVFGSHIPGFPIPADLVFQFIIDIEIQVVTPVAHVVITLLT